MANSTILYACTPGGLLIFNKPGTNPDWLPPRMALQGRPVLAAWARGGAGGAGPPIRVLAAVNEDPTGGEGAGGELLLSDSGGRSWESVLRGPVTSILGLAGDPTRIYVGMESGGLAQSIDGGATWGVMPALEQLAVVRSMWADAAEEGRFYLLLDREGETTLLAGSPEEGGWESLAVEGVADLAQDPETGDLYAATPSGVQMSADRGATWAVLPGSPEGAAAIAAVPGPSEAAPALVVGATAGLSISPDGGATWQDIDFGGSGGVTAIARDPERRDRLYLATSVGALFESGNRGQTWQPVGSAPVGPVHSLFVIRI